MFKKSDEQEWSRFRGALSKDRPDRGDDAAAEPEAPRGASTPAPPTPGTAAPNQGARPTAESNLGPRLGRTLNTDIQDVESMVGERTSFEGTLRSEGSIRVLGSVQGEIECKSAVFVDERARVNANISGAQITIAGQVEGQIRCPGRVEIRSTGRVTGEIQAGALIVQEGAFFDGSSRMATASPSGPATEPSQPAAPPDASAIRPRNEEGTRRP